MYFRLTKTKTTTVLQLIRSYRDNLGKSQQTIIASLGNMPLPKELYKQVSCALEARLNNQESLFALETEVGKYVDLILPQVDISRIMVERVSSQESDESEIADGVLIDCIEHENETELGPSLVLKNAWDELGISNFLESKEFTKSQINSAMASTFNRLLEPCSEHELPNYLKTVSMDELTNEALSLSSDDRYYRVSDALLRVKEELELFLRRREESLFNLDSSIILYDLTNSYFEGICSDNPKAKRGHSKEKRDDCSLLSLGLVVDRNGFPITHEVLEGNRSDSKTLINMIAQLEKHIPPSQKKIIIVDGGIATAANLTCLKENGYEYIVSGKRQSRNEFYEDFCDIDSFSVIKDREDKSPVFVKRYETENELIILCRSNNRKDKENAILSSAEEKFLKNIEEFNKKSAESKRHKSSEKVNKFIIKLAQKYSRASKYYNISYDENSRKISAIRNEDKYLNNTNLLGCYFLRCSLKELPDEEVWKLYTTLTRVENAFRCMKSELGLRPFRHHKESRCDAHAWITLLAYHLMRYVEHTLEQNAVKTTWKSLKRLLQTHCYSTIIIPSKDGKIRRVRKAGKPDEKQRKIYHIFNINYKDLPVIKHTI